MIYPQYFWNISKFKKLVWIAITSNGMKWNTMYHNSNRLLIVNTNGLMTIKDLQPKGYTLFIIKVIV